MVSYGGQISYIYGVFKRKKSARDLITLFSCPRKAFRNKTKFFTYSCVGFSFFFFRTFFCNVHFSKLQWIFYPSLACLGFLHILIKVGEVYFAWKTLQDEKTWFADVTTASILITSYIFIHSWSLLFIEIYSILSYISSLVAGTLDHRHWHYDVPQGIIFHNLGLYSIISCYTHFCIGGWCWYISLFFIRLVILM